MPPAFYMEPERWPHALNEHCILEDQEARHLAGALRMQEGDEVLILNGQGKQGLCRIEKLGKKNVTLALLQEDFFARPASLPIMALAWSKATRRGFFMEKAVELGVHEVWLWQGDHSQGKVPEQVKEQWLGQCIAAMKQCRNPWLPTVRVLRGGVQDVMEQSAAFEHKFLPWEVQEGVPMLTPELAGQPGISIYAIGPEGGFSTQEIATFQKNNYQTVSLGNRILRCETASLLCLGIHWWASQLPQKHVETISS